MGMSEFYGPTDDAQSIRTIRGAIDLGITMLDTADTYGRGHNESLIGRAIEGRRDDVVLATKVGNVRSNAPDARGTNGRPTYVREACERSLERLGVEHIDLLYLHRVDPNTPIEDSVGAMSKLVDEGKIRHIGLCEAGPRILRRAAAIRPIAALQSEYSLWSRDPEADVLPTCRELGIGFVAFSPLGRGFLTGAIKDPADLDSSDRRLNMPRFGRDHLPRNVAILRQLEEVAARKDCSAAQLALAWLLAQAGDIVAIFGTKRLERVEENVAAAALELKPEDLSELDEICAPGAFSGERLNPADMARIVR